MKVENPKLSNARLLSQLTIEHKQPYHANSDVASGLVVWIWLCISYSFPEYLDFVFTMGRKMKKSTGAVPLGNQSSTPASILRFAPHLGPLLRFLGPVVGPRAISILLLIVKKSQHISKIKLEK